MMGRSGGESGDPARSGSLAYMGLILDGRSKCYFGSRHLTFRENRERSANSERVVAYGPVCFNRVES
jgi:hypothetical protein